MHPIDSGETVAWHYATRRPIHVQWENGRLTRVTPATAPPTNERWIAPSLIDQQVNGFAGIDFQQDNLSREDLLHSVRALRRHGCLYFFPTLVTDDWDRLIGRLEHLKKTRDEVPELRAAMVGWHIEGPFLSDQRGFYGAHDPVFLRNPSADRIRQIHDVTHGDRVLITLAPERQGAWEAVKLATSLGCKVFLGHTNASKECLAEAFAAGASGFTHLGNGCPGELPRSDNILWRILDSWPGWVSVIPDRIHVSPDLFRLFHRLIGADRLIYTTDAMAAAGASPGSYRLGRLRLDVGADRVVRLPGTANLAGSALTPIAGVIHAAEMLHRPWQEVWPAFSDRLAGLWNLTPGLAPGDEATFCLIDPSSTGQIENVQTCVAGVLDITNGVRTPR